MDKMEKLRFEFSHNNDIWIKGYDIFNRLYRRKKKIIYTVMFAVLAALFSEQIIRDPGYGVGWVCFAICLAVITVTWISPMIERKNVCEAVKELDGYRYLFTLFDDKFSVETIIMPSDNDGGEAENANDGELSDIAPTECMLSEKSIKAVETDEMIAIFSDRTQCIIPKSDISESDAEDLRSIFKDRFVKI